MIMPRGVESPTVLPKPDTETLVITLRIARRALIVPALAGLAAIVSMATPAYATAPGAVANVHASFDGWGDQTDDVTVSWDAVDGATHYIVGWAAGDVSADDIGSGLTIGTAAGDATSISGTLPQAGGDVTFVVQANND